MKDLDQVIYNKLSAFLHIPLLMTDEWYRQEKAQIERIQAWAETLTDPLVKQGYLSWLCFFADEAERDRRLKALENSGMVPDPLQAE